MRRILPLLTAVSVLLSASLAFSAEIKLGGGGASIATVFAPIKDAFEKSTGHNLILLQSTPKDGLKQLWSGQVEVAVTAVGLDGMIAGAGKDGVKIDKAALQPVEVGTNKTVVLVNPANKVANLNKDQMKGLFTGKITNWKEVGGNDEPVLVIWGKNSPGQNALFTKVILDNEKITSEHLETTDYKGIKESVTSNPGAIGIDPLGMVDDTVKGIKPSPEANSPILLITKGAPSAPVKQLLDFIKGEGKKYIKE
ncbi:phosphate-binding protein PstS 1 [Geobacter sp. OR-1]|uniref:substrate-binding domain-containing protein n=1 Tax=Geobacter sp. OR-1 TaxID=1266765 RepID=UPI000541BAB2|nr:substrate-binding domain-containing protein [Geobacter sp. OR-1]GAM08648.1 phosphate-binding protein PstS 1 [Geobacter sp. OR-1]